MSDGLINLLESVPRYGCEWVFPNPKTLKPFVSFFTSWNTARSLVGLEDVRIHDLRHSYASFLVNAGRSLYEVQRLLGHTQIKTTQRYAHLSHDTLLDATNSVNTALGGMFMPMVPTVSASPVQLVQ
jgi:site-specific recombinase XerD